ncbi:four helix bundle protein [Candidatus Gottesmanbacteria bacterium]|nr:four helix bundle protein [Candidatus Gottesmanbacteria bacterium]
MKSYKELIIWQKSMQLVKEVYLLTEKFPRSEIYGITSQIRRAAVSIPSNIAEGYGRNYTKEYSLALSISYGSALELETQLQISKDLQFAKPSNFAKSESLLLEVLKMLNKTIATLRLKTLATKH